MTPGIPLLLADAGGAVLGANDAAAALGLPARPGELFWGSFDTLNQRAAAAGDRGSGVLVLRRDCAESLLFFDTFTAAENRYTVLFGEYPGALRDAEYPLLCEEFCRTLTAALAGSYGAEAVDAPALFLSLYGRYRLISAALAGSSDSRTTRGVYVRDVFEEAARGYAAARRTIRLPCQLRILSPLTEGVQITTAPEEFAAFLLLIFTLLTGVAENARDPGLAARFWRDRDTLRMTITAHMGRMMLSAQDSRSFPALARLLPGQMNEIIMLNRLSDAADAEMIFGTDGERETFRLSFTFAGSYADARFKAPTLTEQERESIRIVTNFLV